ncbi:MAG: hypothetical protein Q9160_001672 [Pyrenula sp. 1 TL-2023]
MVFSAREFGDFTDLLHFFLHNQHPSVIVVICSKREDFIEQALTSLFSRATHTLRSSPEDDDNPQEQNPQNRAQELLAPTLRSIAESGKTRFSFCPSIDGLRARLSVLSHAQPPPDQHTEIQQSASASKPLLLILDMIRLHHGTSEFSVQGLSRTLANAVEAAAREAMDLNLCEMKDSTDTENPDRGPRLWQAQVPLLSESVKLGPEGSTWARRLVTVQRVAERWIRFPQTKQNQEGASLAAQEGG